MAAPFLLLSQALTSCGSDDDDGSACDPGTLRACAGPGNCSGDQTCNSDGSGYSACSCDGVGAGGSGAGAGGSANAGAAGSSAAGAGGTTGVTALFDINVRAIGSPCATDADCPTGPNGEAPLTCIAASDTEVFFTGGPQGGFCTARCQAATDCQALDDLSGCGLRDENGDGYCVSICTASDDDRIDCPLDRAQACVPSPDNPAFGACFPVCQTDAGCGEGLFCDLGEGGLALCTATQPPGGGVGAPCTEETQEADCQSGICLTLVDPETREPAGSFCSGSCTFGSLDGCGFAADSTERGAVCLQPQALDGGLGDIGLCFELCDVDADCEQAGGGWTCSEFEADLQTLVGRAGECLPPGLGAGDAGVVDAGG